MQAAREPLRTYMRARVAELSGDLNGATAGYAALLTEDAGDSQLSLRVLRQAILAGDRPLAVRAARSLDVAGALPPDGVLLLACDAIVRRDWAIANAMVDRLGSLKPFDFARPLLRAWILFGAKAGDPLPVLETARATPPGAAYVDEQRALLLLAQGRAGEGANAVRALPAAAPGRLARPRLAAAAALQAKGEREAAAAFLIGDDPAVAAARERLAAGRPLPPIVGSAAAGVSELMLRIAIDLAGQGGAPAGLTLARLATFLAPDNATAWLATSELLAGSRRTAAALAALDKIPADDLYVRQARAERIDVLIAAGDRPAALAVALAAARAEKATLGDWSRLGDLYMLTDQPKPAAEAYGRALAMAEAAKASNDTFWPLLLLHGGALEKAGDWPAAKRQLDRSLALAPDQAAVLNHLGYAQLERRENVAEALKMIERASKLRPDDPAITDSLGWALFLRGDVARAVPLLESAAAGDPAEPTIAEHLGDAYWASGRRREARFAWESAIVAADEEADKVRLKAKLDQGWTKATASP